jgi:hypothetical protein
MKRILCKSAKTIGKTQISKQMKTSFLLGLPLVCCMATAIPVHAQTSDFEAWRKQESEKYDKWKKMRAETVGILPNIYMDSVSNFINQGFIVANQISVDKLVKSNMKVWMVVVGIAAYRDTTHANPLQYADDDAVEVRNFYKTPEGGSLPDSQIIMLTDEDATRPNILNAINSIYAMANDNDAIIFYFSGHGSKSAFITYEFDGNIRNNNGLLLHRELHEVFEKSKARYKYLIADACHAGSLAKTETDQPEIVGKGTFYEAFERSRCGFAMLLSCKDNEISGEYAGNIIRHGIFTYHLLEGLKGKCDVNRDRVVSVIELFEYVSNRVRRDTGDQQKPVLSGNYDDTLPIAIVRK